MLCMDKCRSYQILMSEKHIVRLIDVMYGQMSVLSAFHVIYGEMSASYVLETHCSTN